LNECAELQFNMHTRVSVFLSGFLD